MKARRINSIRQLPQVEVDSACKLKFDEVFTQIKEFSSKFTHFENFITQFEQFIPMLQKLTEERLLPAITISRKQSARNFKETPRLPFISQVKREQRQELFFQNPQQEPPKIQKSQLLPSMRIKTSYQNQLEVNQQGYTSVKQQKNKLSLGEGEQNQVTIKKQRLRNLDNHSIYETYTKQNEGNILQIQPPNLQFLSQAATIKRDKLTVSFARVEEQNAKTEYTNNDKSQNEEYFDEEFDSQSVMIESNGYSDHNNTKHVVQTTIEINEPEVAIPPVTEQDSSFLQPKQYDCSLCGISDWKPIIQTECNHLFCRNCFNDRIKQQINENATKLSCPQCQEGLSQKLLQHIDKKGNSSNLKNLFYSNQLQQIKLHDPSKFISCMTLNCSYFCYRDKEQIQSQSQCQQCLVNTIES